MWLKRISLPKLIAITLIIAHLLSVVLCACQPWQAAASAVEALQGKSCQAKVLGAQGISVYVRIEGQDDTIWSGDVTVSESDITADNSGENYHLSMPTALGALDKASNNKKRFQYYVTDTYGSLFVESVGGEENQGINGWLYRVNYYSPSMSAAEFILGETVPPELPHREVLWCYGSGSYVPLKISFDSNEVETDEEFTVMVRVYSDDTNNWSPCEDATVCVDHRDYTTGADGTVDINIDDEGTYDIFAEKDGCIRSDKMEVVVETPAAEYHRLTVNISPEGGGVIDISPNQPTTGYLEDTEVKLAAEPAVGYTFGSWSGDLSGIINPATVTMSKKRKVVANFVLFDTGELADIELVKVDPEVTSISINSYSTESLTDVPSDLDPQLAYVIDTGGNGSFTLRFADVSNAGDKNVYRIADGEWMRLENVTIHGDSVDINMDVGALMIVFALPASQKPASFSASNFDIAPPEVQLNQQVDICISITNDGGETGSYEAVLYVNGCVEQSRLLSVDPHSTQDVVFSVSRDVPGAYDVSLAGRQGQFIVLGDQVTDRGMDVASKIAIVVIVVISVALVFVFIKIKKGVQ